jgi:sugar O-acyltransferase (sialic acid O-acetyltransferase NeuD family)
MKRVAIFGASGCGRGVMPIARQQLDSSGEAYELVFVDDNASAAECNGHLLLSYEKLLARFQGDRYISVAISNGRVRQEIVARCRDNGFRFFEVRARSVIQLDRVILGEGAILCPFVTLTSNIHIGAHFHANIYSYIEHDCQVGDYVTLAPRASVNGNVVIEDHAYIGAGAVIRQGSPGAPLVIGKGAVVGMGAVVTKSVRAGATVAGNPARVL